LPDTSFSGRLNGQVYEAALQPDSRIVVGGDFTGRLARLTADGNLDSTFQLPGMDNSVYSLALQSDGRIVAGGAFKQVAGFDRQGLVRVQGANAAPGGEFEFGLSE
jgi:hypothetical protein